MTDLSDDEHLILHNALNEVANGLDDDELTPSLRTRRHDAEVLMTRVDAALAVEIADAAFAAEVLDHVAHALEGELHARTGGEHSEFDALRDRLLKEVEAR